MDYLVTQPCIYKSGQNAQKQDDSLPRWEEEGVLFTRGRKVPRSLRNVVSEWAEEV